MTSVPYFDVPPFVPHPLLRSGHLQTLASITRKPEPLIPSRVVLAPLGDGDSLRLFVDEPRNASKETPSVMLLHGLGGCAESTYMVRIALKLKAQGLRAIRFNHRNSAQVPGGEARRVYHAGRTGDILAAMTCLRGEFPGAPILAAGFSLSGGMLLRLLGEVPDIQAQIPELQGAAVVCAPLDLAESSELIRRWRNRYLDQYYARRVARAARRLSRRFAEIPTPQLPRLFSLRTFDERFTAGMAGFASSSEYYSACSAKPVAGLVRVPTLAIIAKDDPIISWRGYECADLSPAIQVLATDAGGHMGFISRNILPLGDRRWMEQVVVDWALACQRF